MKNPEIAQLTLNIGPSEAVFPGQYEREFAISAPNRYLMGVPECTERHIRARVLLAHAH